MKIIVNTKRGTRLNAFITLSLFISFGILVSTVGISRAGNDVQASLFDIAPDAPDLPDSAVPVPRGVILFETSLTSTAGKNSLRERQISTSTLIRYGVGHNLELRLSSDGLTEKRTSDSSNIGISDFTVGIKRNAWPEGKGRPGFGIIAEAKLPTASNGLGNSYIEPTIWLNLEKDLGRDWGSSVNFGATWAAGNDTKHRILQGTGLWVLNKTLRRGIDLFAHGSIVLKPSTNVSNESIAGIGVLWTANDNVALDASLNYGLTEEAPNQIFRLGLTYLK